MRFKFNITDGMFTIESKWGYIWIFYFFIFIGSIITLIATPTLLLLIYLQSNIMSIIVTGFISLLSLVFIWGGFKSPAKGYSEKVIFSNDLKNIQILGTKQKNRIITINYENVKGIQVIEKHLSASSNTSNSKSFTMFVVLKEGNAFWVANSGVTREPLDILLLELRNFINFELPELKEADIVELTKIKPSNFQSEIYLMSNPFAADFLKTTIDEKGISYSLKKKKMGFVNLLVITLILSMFLGMPFALFYKAIIEFSGISILMGLFGICWYVLVFGIILLNLRRFSIHRSSGELVLEVKFYLFSFLNQKIRINSTNLNSLIIHRLSEGHFVLAAHLNEPMHSKISWFLSRHLAPQSLAIVFGRNNRSILPIARAEGWNKPGKAPLLEDLIELKSKIHI